MHRHPHWFVTTGMPAVYQKSFGKIYIHTFCRHFNPKPLTTEVTWSSVACQEELDTKPPTGSIVWAKPVRMNDKCRPVSSYCSKRGELMCSTIINHHHHHYHGCPFNYLQSYQNAQVQYSNVMSIFFDKHIIIITCLFDTRPHTNHQFHNENEWYNYIKMRLFLHIVQTN